MTIQYRFATLKSGLQIHAECDDTAQSSAVGIFVRTGTRDEPAQLMGVSHFLEHMMFKGSAQRGAHEVNEAFDEIGARNNAFTSHEMTAYHAHVLPEYFGESVSLVADLLRPALRQEDLDSERNVVLEEMAMYDDNPFWVAYEKASECYYKNHPLGFRVLGTKETVGEMSRQSMEEYFQQHYSPDNSIVVAAGKIDFEKLVAQVEAETVNWKPTSVTRAYPAWKRNAQEISTQQAKSTRGYMVFIWPAPPRDDSRRYASMVLCQIFGDSEGSRLYWSLVETGIAVEASAGYYGRDQCGEVVASVVCATEDLSRAQEIFRAQCAQLADSLTNDDLLRARNKIATGVAMAGESPSGRMQRLGSMLVSTGKYVTLESELDEVNKLTMDDLRRYLREFPFEPVVVSSVVPKPGA